MGPEVVYSVCEMVERPFRQSIDVWWVVDPFEYNPEALAETMVALDLQKVV